MTTAAGHDGEPYGVRTELLTVRVTTETTIVFLARTGEEIEPVAARNIIILAMPSTLDHACVECPCIRVEEGLYGRHAVAAKAVRAGEVVSASIPVAHRLLSAQDDDDGKRRCARCFAQESDTGIKLSRCARCQNAFYCNRSCQKADFPQHKLECQYIMKRRKQFGTIAPESAEEDAVPLLLRTFCALKLAKDKCETDRAPGQIVSCGRGHFASLAVSTDQLSYPVTSDSPGMSLAKRLMISFAAKGSKDTEEATLQEKEKLVLQILGCRGKTLDDAIRHTLTAFQQNNFGVTDSLYVPIGEAVYPHAALLNHSCSPNCILRYKIGLESSPPQLEIVACKDIPSGEELVHSYVDLVLPTETRRKRLRETHGFICECSRCAGKCTVELPRDRQSWMLWPTKERFGEIPSNTPTQQIDIEEAIDGRSSETENLQSVNTSRMLQDQATRAMVNGNNELEIQLLQQAVGVFLLGGGLSPFHNELYTARCAYFSALLANGKIDEAIEQCEHIVSSLSVCLGNVKHHPLLGLQLYTLGDLCSGGGCGQKAVNAYRWAYEIMLVSHGAQDPMVQELIRKRL